MGSRGGTGPEFQIKQFSSKMSFSADIKHSKEVATVARAAEKFSKALYGESPQRIQRRHSGSENQPELHSRHRQHRLCDEGLPAVGGVQDTSPRELSRRHERAGL